MPPPPGPSKKFSFTHSSLAPPLENVLRGPCISYPKAKLRYEKEQRIQGELEEANRLFENESRIK